MLCAPGELLTPSDPNTAATGALRALLMFPTLLIVPNMDRAFTSVHTPELPHGDKTEHLGG